MIRRAAGHSDAHAVAVVEDRRRAVEQILGPQVPVTDWLPGMGILRRARAAAQR
jgi:hypothetical protein